MGKRIDTIINTALDMLYNNDKHLIDNEPFYDCKMDGLHYVGERSIVFRFAHYLQSLMDADEELQEYVLDCEYNRNGVNAKRLPSFPHGVYPDIIIHKRGSNDFNLLVIEVKTYWNANTDQDVQKLWEFVDRNGEYRFQYALSLVIGRTRAEIGMNWIYKDDEND